MPHLSTPSPRWPDWTAALRRVLYSAARYRETTPKNPDRAIHLFRTRIKEARALLRLAPRSLRKEAKNCRNDLARASRALSNARDSVVTAETLRALVRKSHKTNPATLLPELRGGTTESKDQDRTLLQLASSAADHARTRISAWPEPSEFPDILASLATRALRRARKSVPYNFRKATPEAMHDLRKAVIICRYQSAFMNEDNRGHIPFKLLELEKLRKKLGQFNDLHQLETELNRFAHGCHLGKVAWLKDAIRRRKKRVGKASLHLARRALGSPRKHTGETDRN
ncbi:MAG: CHAD domain-containing protein [Hyphomicrobiales bacterium]